MPLDVGTAIIYASSFFGIYMSLYLLLTCYDNRDRLRKPATLEQHPLVSVIIPAHNEEDTIRETIHSLTQLEYPQEQLEIIVVDDGSTDRTASIAQNTADNVTVLQQTNQGKGEALNHGLQFTRGEFVGALDADSYVKPDALKKILKQFTDPHVAAVTPALRVQNPTNILEGVQAAEYLFGIFLRKMFSLIGGLHVTPGPFTIFRKAIFDQYGGYDAWNLTEDVEIALRIQSYGFTIANAVDANVYTSSPSQFSALYKQRLRWYRGLLDNTWLYQHLFRPRYGNLGMFVLPTAYISIIIAIAMSSHFLYSLFTSIYTTIGNYAAINFHLASLFQGFHFDTFYLFVTPQVLFAIIAFVGTISFFVFATLLSGRNDHLGRYYLAYGIAYFPLFALWWVCALYYKITGKKIKWGQKWL